MGHTWVLAIGVVEQYLRVVDHARQRVRQSGGSVAEMRTLSPTFISFIRFLASALRTPSHGVVLTDSKSSTLNCGVWLETRAHIATWCGNAHLDVLAFDDARVWFCFHEPVFCGHGWRGQTRERGGCVCRRGETRRGRRAREGDEVGGACSKQRTTRLALRHQRLPPSSRPLRPSSPLRLPAPPANAVFAFDLYSGRRRLRQ